MNEEENNRIEVIVEKALTLPPNERNTFIELECGNDEELLNEIRSLLKFEDQAFDFLQDLSDNVALPTLTDINPANNHKDPKIGSFINHYHITGVLGSGGMGIVYKAVDTKLQRNVAIKFLPPELTRISAAKDRFIREARAASALDHPNICTVHEINETNDGQIFIVMACYEGESLKDKIERGPLLPDEALNIILQIAQGLANAHSKEIIHRDIKPGNILITKDGQVKIIDFGLAKLKGRKAITRTGTTMGTIAYMSPEQAQGTDVDQRTDIWSLGVILYEMLTGELPFKGEYDQAVIYSIINLEPAPLQGIPFDISTEMERILGLALTKNPDDRYQHLSEMLHDLAAVSKQLGIETEIILPYKTKFSARSKPILYGVAASLFVMTVVILIQLFSAPGESIDSIAVLPLVNLSGDPEQEYFADGMTEALTAELAQISALKVISRTSAMRYKNSGKSIPEIARELNVKGLVEGSVLPSGEDVRVTIQLIDGSNDQHIWSTSYQRNLRNILALQNEIARAVAGEIHVSVSPEEQKRLTTTRTVNPEAYRLFLIGNHQLSNYLLREALESYQKAVELDPDYAPAHAGIAMAYIMMGTWWGSSPPQEVLPKAKEAVHRALTLDPNTAEAHMALGSIKYLYEWDWKGAETAFKRGIGLNPGSSHFRNWYVTFLITMGRFEESIEIGKKSRELDPLSPEVYNNLGFALQYAERYEEAIEHYHQGLRIDPESIQSHDGLTGLYLKIGDQKKALEYLVRSDSLWKRPYGMYGCYYAMAGNRDKAYTILSELIELRNKEFVPAVDLSVVHAGLGNIPEALSWLEKAFEERNVGLVWLNEDPMFDKLRKEPRFRELLSKMSFPG